ncbi:MAG: hypothetical protein KDB23_14620 [Planctomycetales bacterium]|nr:hypothetical protein [Planctomycetales bacterium]
MDLGRRITASIRFVLLAAVACSLTAGRTCRAAVSLGGTSQAEAYYTVQFDTLGLTNPSYTFSAIPDGADLTISFGTHFVGQSFGEMHNSLADTTPSNPLTLANIPGSSVSTMFDLSHPGGLVLGGVQGATFYTTPLAVLFSQAVNYVRFELGHLDSGSPTLVEAFDKMGNSLGIFGGLPSGFSIITLAEDSGTNTISGISVYVPSDGMDWEGFGIGSLKVGLDDGDVTGGGDPQVPEPATWVVWSILGSIACGSTWYSRRRS